MSRQLPLLGMSLERVGKFNVYHDESQPTKRWLFLGLLFVALNKEGDVLQVLEQSRLKEENYRGEIHFSKLPGNFEGEHNQDARIARDWMQAYKSSLCEFCWFSTLAVDFQSPAFQRKRFSKHFHAYNRFTAMALKAAIAWHLDSNYDDVEITMYSDEKSRQTRPDKGFVDNFGNYIPEKVELDTLVAKHLQGKPYPNVRFTGDVIPVESDRDTRASQFIQFTDLLLGAVQQAVVAGSRVETKVKLGGMAYQWIKDIRKEPWRQKLSMHRKLSLWGFPDARGYPFSSVPLAIRDVLDQRGGQGRLF